MVFMRTIHLHIGLPKTATTTIQSFLKKNRKPLEKQGFLYPHAIDDFEGQRRKLVESLGKEFKPSSENREPIPSEWENIVKEIRNSDINNIITSHEGFSKEINDDVNAITNFKNMFHNYNFHIIVYLKRQDLYAESLYKQHIKTCRDAKFPSLYEFLDSKSFNFNDLLEKFSSVFGESNISAIPFEGFDEQKNVIEDFLARIGARSYEKDYILPSKHENPSMSSVAVRAVLLSSFLPISGRPRKRMTQIIRRSVDGKKGKRKNSADSLFNHGQRKAFLLKYLESNKAVARKYAPDAPETLFHMADAWRGEGQE